MYFFLGFHVDLTPFYNDESCMLLGSMTGSEDMTIGMNDVLFFTSGDLHETFNHGTAHLTPGGIYALNLASFNNDQSQQPQRLVLENFDAETVGFQPHGLYVSTTHRMYVVNHAKNYSGIEIFVINYEASPISLTHESTVGNDGTTFMLRTINDVVEGGMESNELYVTEWLPSALPLNGKKSDSLTVSQKFDELGRLIMSLSGTRATHVYRCARLTSDDDWRCALATEMTFAGANGITISSDRQNVYVNDPPLREITVFERDISTGALSFVEKFHTVESMDNIEWEETTGTILMGSIPMLYPYVVQNDMLGGHVSVSGGAVVAKRTSSGWTVERLLTHDGKKMSQVSSAARFHDRIFLGSPFSRGILVCEIPK